MNNKIINYDFEITSPTTYKLLFIMRTTNRLMSKIFKGSKEKLERKGIKFKKGLKGVNSFEIDNRYYKLLSTVLRRQIKKVRFDVEADGITIINHKCVGGVFQRDHDNNDWVIHLRFKGDCIDKR